jgi:protein TonB
MTAKIQGTVQLNLVVGDDGVPRDIVVTRGIDPGLDHNAVAAVRAWKLRPAMRNGTPVAVRARVEVNFRLK